MSDLYEGSRRKLIENCNQRNEWENCRKYRICKEMDVGSMYVIQCAMYEVNEWNNMETAKRLSVEPRFPNS